MEMKVLLVSPQTTMSKGGMAVWTDLYLQECAAHNIECFLLNIAMIGKRAVQGNAKRSFVDEYKRTKQIFKSLKALLNKETFEVAHMNTSCGTFGMLRDYRIVKHIRKKQPQVKIVLQIHCDVRLVCNAKTKTLLRRFLQSADVVAVLNHDNAEFIKRTFSVDCVVLPNFIDRDMVRSDEKTISKTIQRVLFVGYIQPQKGIPELFEVAKRFPNVLFELVGEVRADIAVMPRPENVCFVGKKDRDGIRAMLDRADVFFFPSHTEGFSVALLESMARGVPAVATDVGANAEMLENRGGVIVPVGDIDAMCDALDELSDSTVRQAMSQWNVSKVQRCYTSEAVLAEMAQMYQSYGECDQ